MPQEPVDHSPNWVGLRADIHAHFEDDEEILRDRWELENPQLEPFEEEDIEDILQTKFKFGIKLKIFI